MESKQILKILSVALIVFTLISVTPWYITINKPSKFNESERIREVTNLDDQVKLNIDNATSKRYYKYKNYTVTKTKSLIPYVYKDSSVTNVRYVYSN